MKHLISIIICVLFTWPALVVGYIVGAIHVGLVAGKHLNEVHADEAMAFLDKHSGDKKSSIKDPT